MKLNIFSIYDEKAKAHNTPFFQAHIGQAIRHFQDLSTNTETTINKHPSDYSLYHVGTWDDNNATLTTLTPPKFLSKASEFVNSTIKEIK